MSNFFKKGLLIVFFLLLFFLPWLEGDLRTYGFILLLFLAGLIGFFSKQKNMLFDKIDFLFLIFLIFAAISTIFSQGITRSFLELLRYLSYFIIFVSIRRITVRENLCFKKFYMVAILINSLLLGLISWSFFLPWRLFSIPSSGMNLYHANFGHNNLVNLLLFSLPITYFLIIKLKNQKDDLYRLFTALFIFFAISVLFTFSKSGYLVIVFVVVLISRYFDKINAKINSISKLLIFLVVLVFLFFDFIVLNTYFFHIKERVYYSVLNKPLYLDWRWDYYKAAWEGLKQSPLIGVGLDNFRYLSKKYQAKPASWSDYGENYYSTLFSEVGLLGGLSMLILLFMIVRKLFIDVSERKNLVDCGIFFALVASALHVIFSDDWYFFSIYLYFWVGIAFLIPLKTDRLGDEKLTVRSDYLGLKFLSVFLILFSLVDFSGSVLYSIGEARNDDRLLTVSSCLTLFDQKKQMDIGLIYNGKREIDKALYYFNLARRLEPKDYSSYILIAQISEQKGDLNGAIRNYLQAVSLDPLDLKPYFLESYKLFLLKARKDLNSNNLDNSFKTIKLIIEIFPSYHNRSSGKKNYQEAMKAFENKKKKETISNLQKYIEKSLQLGKADVTKEEEMKAWQLLR